MTRRLAREVAERFRGRRSGVVVFIAPTGYGKTEAAPYAFKNSGMPRAVHVAPMRTLVSAVYEKWLKHAKNIELPPEEVGWQHMSAFAYGKSPYFLRKAVATTFDSFVYNLFKMPVARFGEERSHYELPRSAIFSAFVIYDEAHLYGGDSGNSDKNMFSAFLAAYRSTLCNPTLVITATLPKCVLRKIEEEADEVEVVDYYDKPDQEFEDEISKVTIETWVVDSADDVRPEGKTLYIFNTVERAVEFYKRLGRGAVLLHGRFTSVDREERERELKTAEVVVSTQVVEVGVDIDADTLVTDAAPLTSLIQRAGRVCRYPRSGRRCRVYVLRGDGNGIYDSDTVQKSLKVVESYGTSFDWRRPRDALDEVYGDCRVEYSPEVVTWLSAIDKGLDVSARYSAELAKRLCGVVRDNVLVPVYVKPGKPENLRELGMYSVAVGVSLARKILTNGGDVVVEDKGRFDIKKVRIGDICQELFSREWLALYYPQGYTKEYGLVL